MSDALTRVVVALLLAFHAGLLVLHVLDGRLFQPATSMRWMAGGLLFAGFLALRRFGIPILWGRKAIVLWLLVILLHCHAAFTPADGAEQPAVPSLAVTLATETLATALVGLALLLAAFARLRSLVSPRLRWRAPAVPPALSMADAGLSLAFAPRPPPIR